ncbi:hypothetical protein G5V59_23850 [Nocardioides sp. W3-2-3]|uniref:hypothetical protein n=1 Tax=Nocardioides convexus TaxID=2712224 RepID=UPI0024181F5F|nr:hypothetical protein [Nocardioides convexus]NHA01724.1 hypothetical protein [Nocardioides convexus]
MTATCGGGQWLNDSQAERAVHRRGHGPGVGLVRLQRGPLLDPRRRDRPAGWSTRSRTPRRPSPTSPRRSSRTEAPARSSPCPASPARTVSAARSPRTRASAGTRTRRPSRTVPRRRTPPPTGTRARWRRCSGSRGRTGRPSRRWARAWTAQAVVEEAGHGRRRHRLRLLRRHPRPAPAAPRALPRRAAGLQHRLAGQASARRAGATG